jgi:hypothetical protein
MSDTPRTDNDILISALRILADDIQSEDGVANACISEAADRIEELVEELNLATTEPQ